MLIHASTGKCDAIASLNYTYENMLDVKTKGPSTLSAIFNNHAELQTSYTAFFSDKVKTTVTTGLNLKKGFEKQTWSTLPVSIAFDI
jgi:hypothetical protein